MKVRQQSYLLVGAISLAVLVAIVPARGARLDPVAPVSLPPGVAVFFGPANKIKNEVRQFIAAAQTEILVNEYAITDPDIAADLVTAFKKRHVFVGIILEATPAINGYSTPTYFADNDLDVLVYRMPGSCDNNKYMIIDRQTVLTGSYDLTIAAGRNRENFLAVSEAGIVARYYNDWVDTSRACAPVATQGTP